MDEHPVHTEAAVSRLAENPRELELRVKKVKRWRSHREDATQAFGSASTRLDSPRRSHQGTKQVVLNNCCWQQKMPKASTPCRREPKTPLCLPLHSLPLGPDST